MDTGNTTALQYAVYANPVAAGINAASTGFMDYTSGVYQGVHVSHHIVSAARFA